MTDRQESSLFILILVLFLCVLLNIIPILINLLLIGLLIFVIYKIKEDIK